ncbi:amidase domain-containing protein [Streptomyces avermitilis]|uniref:amidase domain-containing protein n=1 Tax=Streptomyces avermitilis TaxID=33903 RepID=UPI0033F5B7D5
MKIKRVALTCTVALAAALGLAAPAGATDYVTDGSAAPYDRQAAVDWARQHAHPAACTWFVSEALWAGHMQQDAEWTSQDGHGLLWQHRPGTASATAAQPLLDYINRRYPLTQTTPLDANRFRTNAVPEAEPGDIIAYDWQNDGEVDHLSLVVDIADGQYPEIAEWGVVDWNPLGVINRNATTPYAKRGWTYSEKNHNWLQSVEETRNVSAKLIHIDTRNVTTF